MKWAGLLAVSSVAAACAHEPPQQVVAAVEEPVVELCPAVAGYAEPGAELGECVVLPIRPGEACLAVWGAVPEFGEVVAHGGWTLGGGRRAAGEPVPEPNRYGCFGESDSHGALYVTALYRGGDFWAPGAWRVDATCGPEGLKNGYDRNRARECYEAPFDVQITTAMTDEPQLALRGAAD